VPDALILEGTWWRKTATENRLAHLSNVRELNFPDMFIGEFRGSCAAKDGVSQIYDAGSTVQTTQQRVSQAENLLHKENIVTTRSKHLTWPSLFAQSDAMCDEWIKQGFLSIDMETSTVVAVADYFGVEAVSLLSVWDALPHGRTFLDPLSPEDASKLKRSNEIVFQVALKMAQQSRR